MITYNYKHYLSNLKCSYNYFIYAFDAICQATYLIVIVLLIVLVGNTHLL